MAHLFKSKKRKGGATDVVHEYIEMESTRCIVRFSSKRAKARARVVNAISPHEPS